MKRRRVDIVLVAKLRFFYYYQKTVSQFNIMALSSLFSFFSFFFLQRAIKFQGRYHPPRIVSMRHDQNCYTLFPRDVHYPSHELRR